jgi:hypothetical protein
MAVGRKTGGRQKGTPNKATVEIIDKLAAAGCDPILGMARLAMDESNNPELRGRMFAELAQYVAPKRKAVEHSGNDGSPQALTISWVDRPERQTREEWIAKREAELALAGPARDD